MKKGKKLYEGKAKVIFATTEKNLVIQHFKDDATAFNNKKKAKINGKGVLKACENINGDIFESIFGKEAQNQSDIDDFLVGQIGIAYSESDAAIPAKVIKEFNKPKEDNLEVVGVLFEGKRFESDQFDMLANLLTKEELFSKLLSGLQQPMEKLASTLSGSLTKLMHSLENLKQTKT